MKRTQKDNVKAVIANILRPRQRKSPPPGGQLEAKAAAASAKHGGLLFTKAEIDAFEHIATEAWGDLYLIPRR